MADQAVNQCASSSSVSEETPDSTLELNIKTLDSQTYTFKVNKNMLVSLFKEKIANEVGVPVGQQRLIFRGRVLKDDHPLAEYHLENGHTLHLVVRQSRPSSDASSLETTTNDGNQGNDTNGGAPRNRVGQIAHSVVLGTFNVGDQGETVVPDISRVIGAVLNSFGFSAQPTNNSNGTQSSLFSNVSGQGPPGSVNDSADNVQNQAGNNLQSRQTFSGQPFQSSPQVVHIPVTAATAIPIPSVHAPVPDSLDTLLEFINRMEQVLSQNGYQQDSATAFSEELPRTELPGNRRGPSTPEALSVVLRNAQHLLSGQAIAALSHIAVRLEREGASSDPALRAQIQTETTQVGLVMQHLGALLLELGRTILTLRMGQTPAESFVNAGPAVYISSSGPNPIMVQPFPLQTSTLFSGTAAPPNPVTVGPVGIGTAPRHINIHIHAGTSPSPMVSAVGNWQSTGERGLGDHENNTGSVRVLPVRSVVAASAPLRPTDVAFSTGAQSGYDVSASEINAMIRDRINGSVRVLPVRSVVADAAPLRPTDVFSTGAQSGSDVSASEINAMIRDRINEMESSERHVSGDPADVAFSTGAQSGYDVSTSEINAMIRDRINEMESSERHVSGDPGVGSAMNEQPNNSAATGIASSPEKNDLTHRSECKKEGFAEASGHPSSSKDISCSMRESSAPPCRESISNAIGASEGAKSFKDNATAETAMATPLGLGLGGLERKKRTKQPKPSFKSEDSGPSAPSQGLAGNSGQQLLQSFLSSDSTSDETRSRQNPSSLRSGEGSDDHVTVSTAMSQVLENPALDGLLGGISHQTGVGSPNVLRNMMQQLTSNPQIMNTVQQIAQQVDGREIENMMSGGVQGGGLDFSRIVQQMMPLVSRAFSQGGSVTASHPTQSFQPAPARSETTSGIDKLDDQQTFQVTVQPVAHVIEHSNAPGDVFRAIVENAIQMPVGDSIHEDLVNELCCDESLVQEYAELLSRDIQNRFQGDFDP